MDRLLGLCELILSDIGGAEELEVAYLLARCLGAPAPTAAAICDHAVATLGPWPA